ncbi:diphthine methyltransferase isoform X2 [Ceratina calcarata]|uniref:methylated diphthine methylhydrolase n=1 Tax=Ceratina calcarata TaxID=156304 RepID=A0AAJ7J4P1_9HYME|nr:diphthine methyltransferase isoform X2 [Ceratina calcarata]
MEEERGNVDVSTKTMEPLLNVPNPRALQQTVPSVPGQSKSRNRPSMFRTLDTFDTEFSADSVEWCPIDSFKDVFVCGTYELSKTEDELTSKRLGRIYLFRASKNGRITLLQKLDVPAVLDMKWARVTCRNQILLGVANCSGCLQIYRLENDGDEEEEEEEGKKKKLAFLTEKRIVNTDETLALSLDWSHSGSSTSTNDEPNPRIVVSDSKGVVSLFEMNGDGLDPVCSWTAHEFEAWIATFDYWDANVIYSGGDDCKFQRFDARIGTRRATASNQIHRAGVTSIHSNATREFLLSSGSYDEILRLWDTRNFERPVSQTNLRGGIWRLKWDPFARRYLLAACMYGGFQVIDCENSETPCIIGKYDEHESIAYGCDWSFLNCEQTAREIIETSEAQNLLLVATCSFYDHALKLASLRLDTMVNDESCEENTYA